MGGEESKCENELPERDLEPFLCLHIPISVSWSAYSNSFTNLRAIRVRV